ncbi:MAG: glycosyltransferase family 2 protein, partial [Solirubrobacterales bacterium]
PRRESYAGWDDSANRQRLLNAAVEAGAGWVLYLDADERIDADDAAALREFVERAADPILAYGFRVFRMLEDQRHYDRAELWVYRLFDAGTGQTLPLGRLHLVPVPDEIPRERWRKTTIRIQHLSSLTADRRQARLAKYREADPDRRWQRDYSSLVEVGRPRGWAQRPKGLPVLADPLERGAGAELDLAELDPGAPVLSAIVIARNNADTIERTVAAVEAQEVELPFEVIVAASGNDGTADLVRSRFPGVSVVDVAEPGLPGAARNAGLAVARGEYVSFPGSHVELPPGSLAARIAAHERGFSMVTGSVRNGNPTRAGWAAYFLDHAGSLPGRPSGELDATPAHCSYTREALLEVGGFPEDMRAGEDTVVNRELWRRGHRAYRAAAIELTHRNRSSTAWRLARHHFVRGRAFGRILLGNYPGGSPRGRRGILSFLVGYPRWRVRNTDRRVHEWGGELRAQYARSRRLVILGALAAGAGACFEVLLPRRGRGGSAGRPASAPPVEATRGLHRPPSVAANGHH